MSLLDLLVGAAGFSVTAMVIAAMVLLTPGGSVDTAVDDADSMGENLSASRFSPGSREAFATDELKDRSAT